MDEKHIHRVIRRHMIPRRRKTGIRKINPNSTPRNYGRYHLVNVYKELGFNVGAEIGVSRGRHADHMLRSVPGLNLHCIDPWVAYIDGVRPQDQERAEKIYQTAKDRLKKYSPRVHFIRKRSMDALKLFDDESLDFVFIDGNHEYDFACMDIIMWNRKVKRGGIIACHDYYPNHVGVVSAVNGFVWSHGINPWYVTKELEPTAFWVRPQEDLFPLDY